MPLTNITNLKRASVTSANYFVDANVWIYSLQKFEDLEHWESDINFRTGSVVYSKKTDQNGIVVTRDEYGRNKMINNAQTPVYFPKTKKIVAVYNRYLVSLDDK